MSDQPTFGWGHININVGNLDRSIEFLSAPQPAKDGLADLATCVDPDGTLIELLQVYLDKWT